MSQGGNTIFGMFINFDRDPVEWEPDPVRDRAPEIDMADPYDLIYRLQQYDSPFVVIGLLPGAESFEVIHEQIAPEHLAGFVHMACHVLANDPLIELQENGILSVYPNDPTVSCDCEQCGALREP